MKNINSTKDIYDEKEPQMKVLMKHFEIHRNVKF